MNSERRLINWTHYPSWGLGSLPRAITRVLLCQTHYPSWGLGSNVELTYAHAIGNSLPLMGIRIRAKGVALFRLP